MQLHLTLSKDMITPDLRIKIARVKRLEPVLRAMGQAVVNLARRAFSDPALRPTPWLQRKNPSTKPILVQSGLLKRSPRVTEVTGSYVKVGTDRPYAAAHQFGSKPHTIRPRTKRALFWQGAAHPVREVKHPGLPPRPFFPISGTPETAALTPKAEAAMLNAAGRAADHMLK